MNPGKNFEIQFEKCIPDVVYHLRVKDSANNFSQSDLSKFATKNPYDLFMVYEGKFLPMELKSTSSTSFSIQSAELEAGKDIKYHQIKSLTKASEYDGVLAGFVFDFRRSNTYWMSIKDFNDFLNSTEKKSINENDIIRYDGIMIQKRLKRTNYKYDIRQMLIEIAERG